MTDLPANLGRYRLIERISVGGMAEIFRAKATGEVGFEKEVAIKRILPHMATDREFVDMFIDEARTVAQLSHSNICQIFEFGQIDGTYFIAIELVEGKDLRDMMVYHRRLRCPMPVNIVIQVIGKACEALDYAHTSRDSGGSPMHIVHRDVSPQNILVSYLGQVKLIDFGIAKAMGRLTKTQAGSIKGKFSYMSPEQVQAHPVDHRSDIFAAGTVLWECLTNHRLFKGDNEIVTMQLVRKAEITPPSQLNREVPADLDTIVLKALAADPEERYQTAGDLLDDLEEFAIRADLTCASSELSSWIQETFAKEYRKLKEKQRGHETNAEGVMLLRKPKATARLGSESFSEPQAEVHRGPQMIIGSAKDSDEVALLATLSAPGEEFLGDKTPLGMGMVPIPGMEMVPNGMDPAPPKPVEPAPSPPPASLPEVDTSNNVLSQPGILAPGPPGDGGGLQALPTVEDRLPPMESEPGAATPKPSHSGASQPGIAAALPAKEGGLEAVPTLEEPSVFDDDFDDYSQRYTRTSSPRKPLIIAVVVIVIALGGGLAYLMSQRGSDEGSAGKDGAAVGANAADKAPAKAVAPAPGKKPGGGEEVAAAKPGQPPDNPAAAPAGKEAPAGQQPAPGPAPAAKPAPGAAAPAGKKGAPRVKGSKKGTGGGEEALPDFDYIPEGSRAVHFVKKVEELKDGEGDLPVTAKPSDKGPAVVLKDPSDTPAAATDTPATPTAPAATPTAPADKPAVPADKPTAPAAPADKPAVPADKPPVEAAKPPPAQKGNLIAHTIPWSYVWVDGKETRRSTPISESNPIKLSPGKHRVTFVKDGQKFNFPVTITAGKTMSLVKKLAIKKAAPEKPKEAPKKADPEGAKKAPPEAAKKAAPEAAKEEPNK